MNTLVFGSRMPTLAVELRCGDAPEASIVVRKLKLEEGIDRDYRAELLLASDQEFDAAALLGADCEVVFTREGAETRRLFGIIERVEDLGEIDHLQFVRIDVVPAFALLDHGQNSRIWQNKSVRDILRSVLDPALGAYGRSFEFGSTTRGARVRDYCVQYRESDHAFVCRLLEEEGIAFDYVHASGQAIETLTLRDATAQYGPIEGPADIVLIDHDPAEADTESILSLGAKRALTVTSVLRRDYYWRAPRNLLTDTQAGVDERERERRIYLHERRRYVSDELTERAQDALAAKRVDGKQLRGKGNVSAFVPGHRFTLSNASSELDGDHVISRVMHEYTNDQESGGTYSNEFVCFPADIEYRPRQRTPKPKVHGPHTATVVGDDEIHTDEHGRIQVQFHWEEAPSSAAGASCWMRCAQSWSGPGWGAQFIPRVGMEVVVEFLEGNPDRPLVTGCVYNGLNEFPFTVPEHKTQSGWRTRSTPGSEGYNMLRFEDAVGMEEIFIHGQKDWNIIIENDKGQEVRHDEALHVYHDRTKTVGNNETETIQKHRIITVGLTHTETIGINMALTVGVNQLESVGVAKTVTVGQFMTTTVGKDMTTTVVENLSEGVGDSKTATVGVDKSVSVGRNYRIDVGEEFALVCGESSIVMKSDGTITIRGKKIDSETSEATEVRAKPIKLNCS